METPYDHRKHGSDCRLKKSFFSIFALFQEFIRIFAFYILRFQATTVFTTTINTQDLVLQPSLKHPNNKSKYNHLNKQIIIMKFLTSLLFLLMSFSLFAQEGTTLEEYRYLSKGYLYQKELGLDIHKNGYSVKTIFTTSKDAQLIDSTEMSIEMVLKEIHKLLKKHNVTN
jgi:hypothetical protein